MEEWTYGECGTRGPIPVKPGPLPKPLTTPPYPLLISFESRGLEEGPTQLDPEMLCRLEDPQANFEGEGRRRPRFPKGLQDSSRRTSTLVERVGRCASEGDEAKRHT